MRIVECLQLRHSFGDTRALDGVSLAVASGESFALLGRNGAGKSTTFNILCTMLRPTGGSVRILGLDARRQRARIRGAIGVAFQEAALDERLTVRETLEIHAVLHGAGRRERRHLVDESLAVSALQDVQHRLVGACSGGMRRRLELARAQLHGPRILFLDEPTLGLDPHGRRDLWERITAARSRGLTVFMTTQQLHEAEHCTRVGILEHGRLIAVGSPDQLRSQIPDRSGGTLEDVFISLTGGGHADRITNEPATEMSDAASGNPAP